jgi:hypothetical protein
MIHFACLTVTALYRSRDGSLPDFSKMKDSDFEIFFDVSVDAF